MAQTNITQAQILELENSADYQNLAKQFVKDEASYLGTQNGTAGQTAGLTPNQWARQEFLAYQILKNPNGQIYVDWAAQMLTFLKGQPVWDTDVATTIAFLVSSGKFEQITKQVYLLRGSTVEFMNDPTAV